MPIVLDLINNLALLIALSVVACLLGRRPLPYLQRSGAQGVLFGFVAVVGMLSAQPILPGVFFDGRNVALALSGYFFGPGAALVACAMAGTCRLLQGGEGASAGLVGIVLSSILGSLVHRRFSGHGRYRSNLSLWIFGIVLQVVTFGIAYLIAGEGMREVLERIAPPILLTFPLATVLVGRIIATEETRLIQAQELASREALLRATLYSIGDGVVTTDRDGCVVQMNPVAENLTGWTEREARGRAIELICRIVHEQDGVTGPCPARRAMEEGRVVGQTSHSLLISRAGQARSIADSAAPIRDDEGAILGAVLVFRDQSTERASAEALRASRELLAAALEQIPDVVVIYDLDLRIRYINEATRKVTGLDRADFIGRRDDELWPPEVYEHYMPALRLALESGKIQRVDTVLDLPATGKRNLRIACVPLLGPDGRVREVLGITQDLTESHAAAEALRQSEQRFHTVFNQQFQFMAILSPEGVLLEINNLPLRVGGVTRESVLGCYFWETPWWRDLPEVRGTWPGRLAEAASSLEPVLSIDPYQNAAGEVCVAEAAITAVLDESGGLAYFIIQATDITEKQRAREELVRTKKLLEGTFDSLDEAVLVVDAGTRTIVRCNASAERIFGYTPADLAGRGTAILHLDEPHYARFRGESEAALERGEVYHVEYPMRRRDGGLLDGEVTVKAIGGSRDGNMRAVIVVRDVSERKRAQEILAKNQMLLRMAGDVARIGGWFLELPERRLIWSDEVKAIRGYSGLPEPTLEEAAGAYLPESRERIEHAIRHCMASGESFDLELELLNRASRAITVRVIGQAVRGEGGEIVRLQGALQDISELRAVERTLIQSQRRFHQIADALPLVLWTSDAEGVVDFANERFYALTGMVRPESGAVPWLEAVHPEDMTRCLEAWNRARAEGGGYGAEFRLRRHDGSWRWYQLHGLPVFGDDGAISRWYGTATDVHESKMNEERLARTLESITDAFYTIDRRWRFTYVNQEAVRLLECPRKRMLGRIAGRVFPEMRGTDVETHYVRALQDNCTVEFETYYSRLDRWFEVHAYPSEEGLAVYFRDITERVASERELRALSARLQGFLDFSPLMITELDLQGNYLVANRAVADFLHLPIARILGRNISDLLSADAARVFLDRLQQVRSSGEALVIEDTFEVDGTARFFSTMLFPLFGPTGEVSTVGGIAQDITARRRAESERVKLEEQLRQAQKMDAIGRLAGGVAHDFNNMLGVILGFTEMAMDVLPSEHPAVSDLQQVRTAAEHSANLTRQLLAFARKQAIAPEVLDLNATVGSILKMLGRLIGEDITLRWKPGEALWPVRMDPTQIDQILANLAVNARDAIPGVGQIAIQLENASFDAEFCEEHPGSSPGDYVLLTISDSGVGMDRETVAHIFEPFFTTKPHGRGTGLGLATVYGIVKQNGGFISVYSEPGQGTTFRIYLPRFESGEGSTSLARQERDVVRGTETILLVEDEPALLLLARRLLERLGYTVLPANGPAEALAAAAEFSQPIDLLVTDVIMPQMNGKDLWTRLQEVRPGLKALFMSGYTADVIVHHGALDGGLNFIQKPFTLEALAIKIRQALKD